MPVFIEALSGNYDVEQKPVNMKNLTLAFPWKATLKKTLSFWENTIRVNKAVCDIIKTATNNSLALKNSESVDESVKETLRTCTTNECLTKPKVLNPLSVNKSQKSFDFKPQICT